MELTRGDSANFELFSILRRDERHGRLCFDLPDEIPERFHARIQQREGVRVHVASVPHPKPQITNVSSLERCGIWLCGGDAEERGGVPKLGVPATASVFGIPLSSRLREALQKLPCTLRVVYHGTGEENFASICATGLLTTFGQLGTGVYLGSFWKACRFAGRDQDYKYRPRPLVLRVLVHKVAEVVYPKQPKSPCICPLCKDKTADRASACAHTVTWTGGSCGTLEIGCFEDGGWITKNEEWVYSPSDIVRLGEAVRLDKSSIAGPHYDPLQRDIRIV